ncbi:putative Undecaprenyl-phosphate glycosyltransferase [uncultured delta proteobacterium]|uniref:Putative Undecaprenyl-phosphate glycosyltransferase n=1 Tax=uncultured delta proteobacterium TaxID=34034 RepID=A0A212JFH9_9DELT|nr:putative Undecaprenyl-phosphate glycosyltransferase [uncultured delta proteobacterium]
MAMSDPLSVLIVVPVYNHAATLRRVVTGALAHGPVLVVDDGSTDMVPASDTGLDAGAVAPPGVFDAGHPLHGLPVRYVRHARNQGKGRAILTGAAIARQAGASHIVTVDADGQHDPADIPLFLEALAADPLAVFVGRRDFGAADVPASSRFGRAFSNFWFKVQTGHEVGDSQSGFRAYPLAVLDNLTLTESHYSFEVEVLVRAAWAGFTVADVPVRVYYPPSHERVSHFRPFMDNLRLTLLNTRLTVRAIVPVPQKQFAKDKEGKITALHPLRSIRLLLCRSETPKNLALSGALGVFIGTLPIFGLHSITILLVLGSLKRNKIMGLAASQLCMPPLVPALCIEAGHYLRHGRFLTEISWQTLGREGFQRIWEWILGSLLMAPLLAVLCGGVIFALALCIRRGLLTGEAA